MLGILVLGFVIGIVLGSFTKAWADRSILGQSILGRSYCPKCKKTLKAYDLLPVVSYLLTRGRCRYCHKEIEKSYLLVEVLMGLIIALIAFKTIPANFLALNLIAQPLIIASLLFQSFVVCVLVAILITDIQTGYIFDRITYPAIIVALVYLILSVAYKIYGVYYSLQHSQLGPYLLPPHSDYFFRHALLEANPLIFGLISAAILSLFFGGLIFLTRGRGMGGGDLKLGIFIGLVLGMPLSVLAIFVSFILGSVYGLALILSGKKNLRQTIPFGPFLSAGTLIALLWGSELISWYFKYSLL